MANTKSYSSRLRTLAEDHQAAITRLSEVEREALRAGADALDRLAQTCGTCQHAEAGPMPKTRYDSHQLTPEGVARATAIKEKAEELAALLDKLASPPRPVALAHTHLQTSVMFAVCAVAEGYHE